MRGLMPQWILSCALSEHCGHICHRRRSDVTACGHRSRGGDGDRDPNRAHRPGDRLRTRYRDCARDHYRRRWRRCGRGGRGGRRYRGRSWRRFCSCHLNVDDRRREGDDLHSFRSQRCQFDTMLPCTLVYQVHVHEKVLVAQFAQTRGRTDEGERYGGFFPIAGNLKERFGRDEIQFYLWPLYSRIEDEGEITWRTPWPVFSRFGGAAEGLYIWPLWGHRERAGEYKRGFTLWPCYVYIDEYLNTDNPVTKRFYLPFYATVRSPQGRADIFLPPFFFHQWAYNSSFVKWEFPWPFFTLVKGEGVSEWQVFPLFRLRTEEHKKRFYCLWPLYKYEWDLTSTEEEVVRRFLLINKYRVVKELKTEREALDANLWPLFDYRRGLAGEVSFSIFPLLPLHDEGMERNIYPLAWVYRYTRSPEDETLSDFLWGLYRRRTSPEFSSTRFAFFLRINKHEDERFFLSLFEGLFRYQRTPEGGEVGFFFMGPSD